MYHFSPSPWETMDSDRVCWPAVDQVVLYTTMSNKLREQGWSEMVLLLKLCRLQAQKLRVALSQCHWSGILEGLLSSGITNHFCLTSHVLRVRFLGHVDLELALLCICSYHSL